MRQNDFKDILKHLKTSSYFQDILNHLKTTEDILRAMSINTTYRHVSTSRHLNKYVLRRSSDVSRHFEGWNWVQTEFLLLFIALSSHLKISVAEGLLCIMYDIVLQPSGDKIVYK